MAKIKRYLRNHSTISLAQQEIISNSKVLVIGLGGLGSHMIEGLARTGFKTIGICDYDVIDESNLNRQLLALENTIDKSKLKLANDRIKSIDQDINIILYDKKYPNAQITKDFASYDIIIDCLDSIKVRKALEYECLKFDKNLIYGTIAGNYGYCGVVNKDNQLIEQQLDGESIEKELGNPYYIVSIVAGVQLVLTIKVITNQGYLKNGFYSIDLDSLNIEEVEIK